MTTFPQLDPNSLVARIVAELQANPDAQALLLRALLTNEFLGMPIRLERVEAMMAEFNTRLEHVETTMVEFNTRLEHVETDMEVVKANIVEIKGIIVVINTRLDRLESDVAVIKGDSLEVKLHRRVRSLLSQRFGLRGSRILQSPVQDTSPELFEPVEQAADNGTITDAQETRINTTDIILRARRKEDGSQVLVAVEVSNSITRRDIERAGQSAEALRTVFQQDAPSCGGRVSHPPPGPGASGHRRRLYHPDRGERLTLRQEYCLKRTMKNLPIPRLDKSLQLLHDSLLKYCRLRQGEVWTDPHAKHKVGCLDAASLHDIQGLMEDEKAVVAVQDPPYNLSGSHRRSTGEFINWCKQWVLNTNWALAENSSLYIWIGADQNQGFQPLPEFMIMMRDTPFTSRIFITMRNQRGYGTSKNWDGGKARASVLCQRQAGL